MSFGCIDLASASPGSQPLLGLLGDIPIWLIEVLSRTEKVGPNALIEADSIDSEANCGSFNEARSL